MKTFEKVYENLVQQKLRLMLKIWTIVMMSSSMMIAQYDASIKSYMPVSPTAASFAKNAELPVNHFSGSTTVEIPITTITDNQLSHQVSLVYNTSGIKAAEIASSAGLGWQLTAGGAITRSMRGAPDERLFDNQMSGYYTEGVDPAWFSSTLEYERLSNGIRDGESDVYYFNFDGYSGSFSFDNNHNVVMRHRNDIKVIPILTNYNFNKLIWKMITPDGTVYYFGDTGTGDGVTDDAVSYSNQYTQPKNMVGAPGHTNPLVDSWYLVRKESFDGTSVIDFQYDQYEAYSFRDLGTSAIMHIAPNGSDLVSSGAIAFADLNPVLCTESLTPRLTKIIADTRHIVFEYGTETRRDLDTYTHVQYHPSIVVGIPTNKITNAQPLGTIKVQTPSNTLLHKYMLKQDYFISPSVGFTDTLGLPHQTDAYGSYYTDMRRLRLDSVLCITGTEVIAVHGLQYYNSSIQRRLTYALDDFGFPNGKTDNITLVPKLLVDTLAASTPHINLTEYAVLADRSPDATISIKPMLKKISYPEGGSREIAYEGHDYYTNTVAVVATSMIDLKNANCSSPYPPSSCTTCCLGQYLQSTVVNLSPSNSRRYTLQVKGIKTPNDMSTLPIEMQVLRRYNGSSNFDIMDDFTLNSSNNYNVDKMYDEILFAPISSDYEFAITAPTDRNLFMMLLLTRYERQDVMMNRPIGGLRIKTITDKPLYGNDIVKSYTYETAEGSSQSSGYPISFPSYVADLPSGAAISINCAPNNILCLDVGYRLTSGNTFPLASSQGSHIGYARVTARTSTTNGYSEYTYHTDHNDKARYVRPFPNIPEYMKDEKTGYVTYLKEYNNIGALTSQEYNTYLIYNSPNYGTSWTTQNYGTCCVSVGNVVSYINPSRLVYKNGTSMTKDNVVVGYSFEYTTTSLGLHTMPLSQNMYNSDNKAHKTEYSYIHDYTQNTTIKDELLAQNRINVPWQIVDKVQDIIVDGRRTLFAYVNSSTGDVLGTTAISSGSRIYPALFERKNITWTSNGTIQDNGWKLKTEIKNYHLTSGRPTRLHFNGYSQPYYMTWNTKGQLTQQSYGLHAIAYGYHPDTEQLVSKNNIDAQVDSYEYDGLLRLKTLTMYPKNVVTNYRYRYRNNSNIYGHIKTRTNYPLAANSAMDSVVHIAYVDGLGRPIQAIHKYGAPNGADVITKSEYDNVGRNYRDYEAIPVLSNHGAYYTGTFSGGYTEQQYYADPLDRMSHHTPPAWQTTQTSYGTNTAALTNPEGLVYPASSLMLTTTTDPDGLHTDVYSDKLGKSVLMRRRGGGNTTDTWTVYDDRQRPVTIYPPGSSPTTPELIHRMVYDGDDNITWQKKADATAEEYRYSARNLQTARRNAILTSQGKWLVTHYDIHGRPTKRGYFMGADPGTTETPTISTLLEEYFYDGYNGSTTNSAPIYKGKLKKSRIKVLEDNGTNANWVETEYSYDSYGRVSTENITNHLGGSETKTYGYDFADHVTTESHVIAGANGVTHVNNYTYDAQGRKIYDKATLNSNPEVTTASYNYDHKNQIAERNLGRFTTTGTNQYLQSLDYTYNAQGWLTAINALSSDNLPNIDPCDQGTQSYASGTTTSSPDNDIFALGIDYNATMPGSGVPARQNGNITTLKWWHANQYNQTYSYMYDHLNRVTTAKHGQIAAGVYSLLNQYNEKFQYDSRGNILKLDRQGMVQRAHIHDQCYQVATIDSLDYIYELGSNRLTQVVDKAPCPDVITLPAEIDRDIIYAASQEIRINNTTVNCGVNMDLYAPNTIIIDSLKLPSQSCTAPIVTTYPGPCPQTKYTEGFQQQSASGLYTYDNSGNMTYDPNKKLNYYYNYLNLAYKVVGQENDELQFLYSADGTLLQRKHIKNNTQVIKKDYLRSKEYMNDMLESVYHDNGRALPNGGLFTYEYHIKDHLGNVRVTFEDFNSNGTITFDEIKSRNDYYSFGMEWNNKWEQLDTLSPLNLKRYNGKELVTEMNLDMLDYHARMMDPALGRFWTADILSHTMPSWSGYSYGFNNPIRLVDPDGKAPEDIIIRGTKDDKGDAFRIATFNAIQSLTNDKLKLGSDGRITIVSRGDGNLQHGTELIRNLVDGKTGSGKDFDVVVTNDSRGTRVNTKVQAETFADSPENASNGIGTGSKIVISHELDRALNMQDGTREKVPYNIAVSHELIHTDHNREGSRDARINDIPYVKNNAELRTINNENLIRKEHGLNLRYSGAFIKK